MIPALLSHTGPVVSTSTKPDVTRRDPADASRSTAGLWVFDPTGAGSETAGVQELRWSPVTSIASTGTGRC